MRRRRVAAVAALAAALAGPLLAPAPAAADGTGPVFAAVGFANGVATLLVGRLGGTAHVIFRGDQPAAVQQVAVSPGGHRIAFIETRGAESPRLAVINVDGSGHRLLTANSYDRDMTTPVWSPDGKYIYTSIRRVDTSNPAAAVVVPADGSTGAQRITNGSNAMPTATSRGGVWLAFNYGVSGERWLRTGIMHVDGTARRSAGPANLWNAKWRPSSPILAVSRVIHDSINDGSCVQIQLLNVDAGSFHALSVTQSTSIPGDAYPIAWSHDGSHLFYEHYSFSNGEQVHPRIYRLRADGTGRTDVTPQIPTWTGGFALQWG